MKHDSREEPEIDIWRQLLWVYAFSPWAVMQLGVVAAIVCRLALGHWPVPMVESYSGLGFDLGVLTFYGAFLSLYVAGPLVLILLTIALVKQEYVWQRVMPTCVFLLGWGFFVGLLIWDPTRVVEWFVD